MRDKLERIGMLAMVLALAWFLYLTRGWIVPPGGHLTPSGQVCDGSCWDR